MKTVIPVLLCLGLAAGQWLEKVLWLPDSLCGVVEPSLIAFDWRDGKFYVAGGERSKWATVIDGAARRRIARFPVPEVTNALCYNPVVNKLYCASRCFPLITIVDCYTDEIVAAFNVGRNPVALCLNATDNKVYSANEWSDDVAVIDGATNEVLTTITTPAQPRYLCWNSRRDKVYCGTLYGDTLTIIDGRGDSIIGTLVLPQYPLALLYNPKSNKVYCPMSRMLGDSLAVIDGDTDSVSAIVALSGQTAALCWNTLGNKLYCATFGDPAGAVVVVDGIGDSVIATIPVMSEPRALCYDSSSNKVYCAGYPDRVVVIDAGADTLIEELIVGAVPAALCAGPATGSVCSVNKGSDDVAFIDVVGDSVATRVAVGSRPRYICHSSGEDKLYCANGPNGIVSVIDGATNRILGEVRVGQSQDGLCYDSTDDRVYTTDGAYNGSVLQPKVNVICCAGDSVVAEIAVPASAPRNPCYCSRENKVYCTSALNVVAIDCETNSVVATLPISAGGVSTCYNWVSNKVYIGDNNSVAENMTIIDCTTDTVLARLPLVICPMELCFNPLDNKVYRAMSDVQVVCGKHDSILIQDLLPREVIGSVCYNATNDKVYFGSAGSGWLLVFDGAADTLLSRADLGSTPVALCYEPSHNKAYCNTASREVFAIDGNSDQVVATVAVPYNVTRLFANPRHGTVYASHTYDGAVSVLKDTSPVAIGERTGRKARGEKMPAATVVCGVLRVSLPLAANSSRPAVGLYDADGRKAMELAPGDNDVRCLAPGVYFVRDSGGSALRKLILAR